MGLERARARAYREMLQRAFTGMRHNLPFIAGNPVVTRLHHGNARIIAGRMQGIATASVRDFRDFDESAFWIVADGIDPGDAYLRPFCDRAGFEEVVADGKRKAPRTRERQDEARAMPPARMAAYRSIIDAANRAIRELLETDRAPHADSYQRRVVIALADRMHNLAAFSAADFVGFDEAWFWEDDVAAVQRIHPFMPRFGRSAFERDVEASASLPGRG